MANKARGETTVTLGGKQLVLRPTFEAVEQIQDRLGERLVPLISRLSRSDFGVRDIAVPIHEFARAGGSEMEYQDIGELVLAEGLKNVAPTIMTMITDILLGPEKKTGVPDEKPETEKTA